MIFIELESFDIKNVSISMHKEDDRLILHFLYKYSDATTANLRLKTNFYKATFNENNRCYHVNQFQCKYLYACIKQLNELVKDFVEKQNITIGFNINQYFNIKKENTFSDTFIKLNYTKFTTELNS